MNTYHGPCRAGLHPEFGWGEPCRNDAAEYVSVDSPVAGISVGDDFFPGVTSMRLCSDHADEAMKMPGNRCRQALTVPYEPPVVTL